MSLGKILFRADASAEVGTGHVMRCLALAQAWHDAGGEAMFVMARSTSSVRSRLATENILAVSIDVEPGSAHDASCTNGLIRSHKPNWVVLDGYRFDAIYESRLGSVGYNLLCIDDDESVEHPGADLVLRQDLTAKVDFQSQDKPNHKYLLGTRFCLLRREFLCWRTWQREIPAVGRRILITLGGSTPVTTGAKLIEAIYRIELAGIHAVFVVGGSTPTSGEFEKMVAESEGRISIRNDVSNMAMLMSESDVAISAAGSTCWELCLLGVPSVLTDLAENQTPVALELQRRRCALYAGSAANISAQDVAKMVAALLKSQKERRLLSQSCRQLVDGNGAERVVTAMRSFPTESVLAVSTGTHI